MPARVGASLAFLVNPFPAGNPRSAIARRHHPPWWNQLVRLLALEPQRNATRPVELMEGVGTMLLEAKTTTRTCGRPRIRLAVAAFTSAGLLLLGSPAVGVDYDRGDVFVRDLASGTTERISVSSTGAQGNGDSLAWPLAISNHG